MWKRSLLLFLKVTLSHILLACVLVVTISHVAFAGGETFIGLLPIVSLILAIVHVVVFVGGPTVFNGLLLSVVLLIVLVAFSLRASLIHLAVILLGHLIITGIVSILTIDAVISFVSTIIHLIFILSTLKVELLLTVITGFILTLIFALITILCTFIGLTVAVLYVSDAIVILPDHLRVLRSILRWIIGLGSTLRLIWRRLTDGFLMVAIHLILHRHRVSDFWNCCGHDLDW